MNATPKKDIDNQILFVLGKINDEYEVVKRQGFPSHVRDSYSRSADATIPSDRWHSWASKIGIDYIQLKAILKILENEGLLEKFEFVSEYI